MVYTIAAGYGRAQRQLRRTSGRILETQEDERRRLARELHDGVGQSIAAVKLQLELLGSQIENETDRASSGMRQHVDDLVQGTEEVIDELHRVAVALRPDVLEQVGFVEALREFGDTVSRRTGLRVSVDAEPLDGIHLPADHLYRVVQESFNNAIRHAGATELYVELRRSQDVLNLNVRDNGSGFDPVHQNGHGLGLATMRERVELLGGRLRIESRIGHGTVVSVELPLADDNIKPSG